jgi:hypothetical protein
MIIAVGHARDDDMATIGYNDDRGYAIAREVAKMIEAAL